MNRPGDWNCRLCQHLNFQRRDSCQSCGDLRPIADQPVVIFGGRAAGGGVGFGVGFGVGGAAQFGFSRMDMRPGHWFCMMRNCGAHNIASRSFCFLCGASVAVAATFGGQAYGSSVPGLGRGRGGGRRNGSKWKTGDWICTRDGCNMHNFASRTQCYRCNAPKTVQI